MEIQGYIPAIKRKNRKRPVFVSFSCGGLTRDYMEAHCVSTHNEATEIAHNHSIAHMTPYDLAGSVPVDEACELVFREWRWV